MRVDLEHLRSFTGGDVELEREVFQSFLDQAQIFLGRLREAESLEPWIEAAHGLKGSARAIGANPLGAQAEKVEQDFRPREDSTREALLATLEEELNKVSDYLLSLHSSE